MFLNQCASFLLGTVAAVALAAAASSGARADQINVSATITASCSVGDADLEFGNYDPAADSETSTTLTITCTAPADVGVTLGNGQNPNGSRRMKHAADESFLSYELFDGSVAEATPWTSQEVIVQDVSNSPGTGVLIGGRILATQTGLPSGTYSDVVLVTLDVKS